MQRHYHLAVLTSMVLLVTGGTGLRPVEAAISPEVLEAINQPKATTPPTAADFPSPAPPSPATSVPPSPATLPVALLTQGSQQALIPDWSKISFSSLAFAESGSLVGPDLERHWSAGQPVDQVMTLGDFQDSLNLDGLNLYAVNKIIGRELDGTRATQSRLAVPPLMLDEFKLMEHQTIASLVKALPDLAKLPISEIAPIADLLRPTEGDAGLKDTLADLLKDEPNLGTLRFDSLDLSNYKVSDIPGLDHVPFQAFKDWQQASINDIPGLRDMPWSQFPTPPNQQGVIGKMTVPEPSADEPTGDYINLSGSSALVGKRWFSGERAAAGGTGWLAATNGGVEPIGRTIYGPAFNVVLSQIGKDGISSTLYFHACQSAVGQVQISCTPYAIGPIAFMHYANGDGVFLGDLDSLSNNPAPPPLPAASAAPLAPAAASSPLVVELIDPHKLTFKAVLWGLGLIGMVGIAGYLGIRSLLNHELQPTPKKGKKHHGHP